MMTRNRNQVSLSTRAPFDQLLDGVEDQDADTYPDA